MADLDKCTDDSRNYQSWH